MSYTAPRRFLANGVEYVDNPIRATGTTVPVVGLLYQIRADKTYVLADASTEVKATHVCVDSESNTSGQFAKRAGIWKAVSGAGTTGHIDLFLGEDGATTSTPTLGGTIQNVGEVVNYDSDNTEHFCSYNIISALSESD